MFLVSCVSLKSVLVSNLPRLFFNFLMSISEKLILSYKTNGVNFLSTGVSLFVDAGGKKWTRRKTKNDCEKKNDAMKKWIKALQERDSFLCLTCLAIAGCYQHRAWEKKRCGVGQNPFQEITYYIYRRHAWEKICVMKSLHISVSKTLTNLESHCTVYHQAIASFLFPVILYLEVDVIDFNQWCAWWVVEFSGRRFGRNHCGCPWKSIHISVSTAVSNLHCKSMEAIRIPVAWVLDLNLIFFNSEYVWIFVSEREISLHSLLSSDCVNAFFY